MSYAVRNPRLCTKSCLCLFVCPTGATNHESGQIDRTKCIDGCRKCVDICPEHAISLMQETFPEPPKKKSEVCSAMGKLSASKTEQEAACEAIARNNNDPAMRQLASALAKSIHISTEDLVRESGYLIPTCKPALDLLQSLVENPPDVEFPLEKAKELIHILENEKQQENTIMEFKDSKTAANLAYAFAGESQARNKYTYFASAARKEGYEQIAAIFEATANNEKEHAKLWFKALNGIGSTLDNLKAAAAGEHEEWTEMYKNFAEEAKKEGYDDIARLFERVAAIEKRHEERYRKLAANIEHEEVWVKVGERRWECRNCGHIYIGEKAPEVCPVCKHPKAFFEIEAENY